MNFELSLLASAGDSTGISSITVIRSQLRSIANEVVDQAKLDPKDRVSILVESEKSRLLVENAFIEALQERGYISILNSNAIVNQSLQVVLLELNVKVQEFDSTKYKRNIQTALEVCIIVGSEHEVRFLGTFHRELDDTVQFFPEVFMPVTSSDDNNSILQRLFTPLIIIGSAILIIYLFFTVRS
jgi:hypothetical protein